MLLAVVGDLVARDVLEFGRTARREVIVAAVRTPRGPMFKWWFRCAPDAEQYSW